MFAQDREFVLPRRLTDTAGHRHRRVRLRPLDGRAEMELARHAGRPVDRHTTDSFLADRIERLGGYEPVTPELAAELSRADRDRLVLEIRADVFGDRLLLTTRCQNPSCQEEADLDLSVDALLHADGASVPDTLEVPLQGGGDTVTLRVRPVLGRDDPDSDNIWPDLLEDGTQWDRLSPEHRQQVALALMRSDIGPDLAVTVACPSCGGLIEVEIDPMGLLASELRLGAARLTAEIHCLAFHYGWSEADILALPRHRRWRYLELITAQVTGGALSEDWR